MSNKNNRKPDELPNEGLVELGDHVIDTNVTPLARFLDGETGEPISDEEWDEQKRRLEAEEIPDDEIIFDDAPAEVTD